MQGGNLKNIQPEQTLKCRAFFLDVMPCSLVEEY